MAPGGEFRRAFIEAIKVPGCKVHLGDRPINITLKRALAALGPLQKLRLGWNILTSKDSITRWVFIYILYSSNRETEKLVFIGKRWRSARTGTCWKTCWQRWPESSQPSPGFSSQKETSSLLTASSWPLRALVLVVAMLLLWWVSSFLHGNTFYYSLTMYIVFQASI